MDNTQLVGKINEVMKDLGAVEKKGKNAAQNYNYLAQADVLKALHPLLVKKGLVISPKRVQVNESSCSVIEGRRQNRVVLSVFYIITDGVSELEFSGIGEGVDPGDKSSYKAQTGAFKYALKGLFCIPDELDAEVATAEELAESPHGNAAKVGNSTQKAGVTREATIKNYADANLIPEKKLLDALAKYGVEAYRDLPKDVAEKIIEVGAAAERKLNGGKQ